MTFTRRRLLAGSAGLLGSAIASRWLPTFARAPLASAITVPESFLTLSQTLTGMMQPEAQLAQHLYSWLYQQVGDIDDKLNQLTQLLAAQPQGEDLLVLLERQPASLRDLYQTLVSGWYLGVVNPTHPACLAFENIVSYRLVSDSLRPPSYAPGEPNFWIHPPRREGKKNV